MGRASFDRVLDAFRNKGLHVQMRGNEAADAQAPGHSAKDRSVSVQSVEGQTLVHSHSDPTQDVLYELGLTMQDLFDEKKGVEYRYRDGRVVHRSPDKKFRQSGNTKGKDLYHVERIGDADPVWMVEGEKDVHALEALGRVAVCTAMGAGKAAMFDLSPLHNRKVLVVRDMDETGLKHALQVRDLLEGKSQVVILEPLVGKDAADHVAAGHGWEQFRPAVLPEPEAEPEPVNEEFERAVAFELERLEVKDEVRRRRSAIGAAELQPIYLDEVLAVPDTPNWLIPDLLERRDRLVLTGSEGSGKSYFTRQLAIAAAAGVHPFNGYQIKPLRVLAIDAENTVLQWSRNTRYLASLAGQYGVRDPGRQVLVSAGVRLDLTRQADVDQVHRLIDRHQPDMLLIGPLYKLVPQAINNDDDAAPLIVALDGFRERGVAMVMEAHAGHGKSLGGERDLRPRGSAALLGWPEFGLGLRTIDDDDSMVHVVRWRGDRDPRDWPHRLRRGVTGEMPWMPA
ncbi:AAA family ATPase [Curtobacterium sp. ISL-83]|uniref:AAA family ATPase n=1 Tax=Curtobacterium sp. ISL-83 TaxID=2819145 RepID=UPI001BE55549|nr:AAA family ATPase [Curtobacterium sp. ISL-83]MBT2502998.1 AAA family ATPase [Curtobacterium sp. ISL-83]